MGSGFGSRKNFYLRELKKGKGPLSHSTNNLVVFSGGGGGGGVGGGGGGGVRAFNLLCGGQFNRMRSSKKTGS